MKLSVFWFRRDLRLEDNRAFHHALNSGHPVLAIFIFDQNILDELPKDDARVSFIYRRLKSIDEKLRSFKSSLLILQGEPAGIWEEIVSKHEVAEVYINSDYEPYAVQRDSSVENVLTKKEIPLYRFKDQVIFEQDEVVKKDGSPYTVFTPYRKRWLEKLRDHDLIINGSPSMKNLFPSSFRFPELIQIGFRSSSIRVRPYDLSRLDRYARFRDYPAEDATSHLSPHLRFGTVSIRRILSLVQPGQEVFLSELIWREFFMQILYHFPEVVNHNFKSRYNGIEWRNKEEEFERWCSGNTGYPIVDAGMRELNRTGYMHNRVRMVTASFLCKHLLIDWRWGEAYFAQRLLDYELSSNNGNWQWAAGTGCDAAPYFRVFNPHEQTRKFDKKLEYVKKWVPEYGTDQYPDPIVDHTFARKRAIETYKQGISQSVNEN